MLSTLPFRRFVEQLGSAVQRQRRSARLRTRRLTLGPAVAACVETLEGRQLLSSIVVTSLAGGQNYASNVTAGQLDPAQTAVTLRDAIHAANNTAGADTITFDAAVFPPDAATPATIVLAGGTPLFLTDTSGATTIAGPGAAQVAVSGNNLSTVFQISLGVSVEISGLSITGGQGSFDLGGGLRAAGGIYNRGTLTVTDSLLTGNAAGNHGGGLYNAGTVTVTRTTISGNTGQLGGGLFNSGTATLVDSTLAGNSVTGSGGGFYSLGTVNVRSSTLSGNSAIVNGGGFFSNNTVSIVNSTLAGNTAGSSGGGFINLRNVSVIDSTIAGNFAAQGAGVFHSVGSVTLFGTILARNTVSAANATPRDWGGLAASAASTHNLIGVGTGTGLVHGVNNNLVGSTASPLDPLLAPLGDYGGPTQTMALLPGSLARDAGAAFINPATGAVIATDQRGVSRPQFAAPDIGAYELLSHPPAVPTVESLTTTDRTPTLTGTWDDVNAVLLEVTITNAAAAYSAVYVLGSSPELVVSGGTWTLNLDGILPLAVGAYSVSVHTANELGESADSALGTLVVNATPPVLAALGSVTANVGESVNLAVAVTGGDTDALAALIDWGDGTTTTGTVVTVAGVLTITGSHAYAAAGVYNIQVAATNAFDLSAAVSATATITQVVSRSDLQVTLQGDVLRIVATDAAASHDVQIAFVSGGVLLTGTAGTTFNGAASLLVANAASVLVKLGGGDDRVYVSGTAKGISLALGAGQNDVTLRDLAAQKVHVVSDGGLALHAWNSALQGLLVKGGAATADLFEASGLRVTGDTILSLGGGANTVRLDNSAFRNFALESLGSGTVIEVETGPADGVGTQFDGTVVVLLGRSAQISVSPSALSDRTTFSGLVLVVATKPGPTILMRNVAFAKKPILLLV